MVIRCQFANTPNMIAYHDEEWGQDKTTSQEVFEALCLESMQAGLSWAIILKKRPALRVAFADFYMEALAMFDKTDFYRIMLDDEILRHRLKIQAFIYNVQISIDNY